MDQHAIIIANASGVIQFWSAGAAALFGYQATDAVGKKLDLVVPPDLREAHWHGFGHAMENSIASGEGTFFDAPALCSSGEKNEAMALLQKVYDDRSESIVWLKVSVRSFTSTVAGSATGSVNSSRALCSGAK